LANWGGVTNTIAAGTTGTLTAATINTATNSGANWPLTPNLQNFIIRILTGTGAGQERTILSNTATQITTTANWSVTPDNTSTYEIVLLWKNGDHVVGNVLMNAGIITELEDNAIIYLDGSYSISSATGAATWRWQKTYNTMVTFQPNNMATAGTYANWLYIYLQAAYTGTCNIAFLKLIGASNGILNYSGASATTNINKCIIEGCTATGYSMGTPTSAPPSKTVSGFLIRNASGGKMTMPTYANSNTHIFERNWTERTYTGGLTAVYTSAASQKQIYRENVCKFSGSAMYGNTAPGKSIEIYDNYLSANIDTGMILAGPTTAAAAGTTIVSRNVAEGVRQMYAAPSITTTCSLISKANDYYSIRYGAYPTIDPAATAVLTAVTSDYDFMAGTNGALPMNVDVSTGTTSASNPQQFKNLTTSRTLVATDRNKQRVVSNVVATPSYNSCTITFDCALRTYSGWGNTTVNVNSNSGQPTLSVASVTGFEVGEIVEIGFGTARQEFLRVASIGASSLTFETNLTFTHTSVQADVVTKSLRTHALPYVKFGEVSGEYKDESALPNEEDFGLVWTGINQTFNGITYEWKTNGHSVTINGLRPQTTYYFKAFGVDPLGNTVDADTEHTFLTTADPNTLYTDPGVSNVRLGTTYQFNSLTDNRTGTARIPASNKVQVGYNYDSSDSLTGTYDGSDRYTDPGQANVLLGQQYAHNSLTNNRTGTLESTDPGENNVVAGNTYKINSVNKTGTFVTPISKEAHGAFSINAANQLEGILWFTDDGLLVNDPGLTSASYWIYDKDDVLVGIQETGITPTAGGKFLITPAVADALQDLSVYSIKISIVHNAVTYTSVRGITIGE
jgi:hypothetical protein